MAFAGQAPTIVVLKEGPYRPQSICNLDVSLTWDFCYLMDRDGHIPGKGSDCFEH